jgi:predicted metal-dependent phosphoesterase TrpH
MNKRALSEKQKNVLEYIDAIEGFNSRCILDTFNRQARKFAKEHGKPVVAGSDAHFANEVGRAFTLVDCERNEESVLEAVRAGRTEIVGHKTNIIKHIHSKIRRELKK